MEQIAEEEAKTGTVTQHRKRNESHHKPEKAKPMMIMTI
jgi:hypothetical protein